MILPRIFYKDEFNRFEKFIESFGGVKRIIHAKTILYDTTDSRHNVYYIYNGIAEWSLVNEEGHKEILALYGSGSLYPINLFNEAFSLENVLYFSALTDIEVINFSNESLKSLIDTNKDFAKSVVNHYCRESNLLITKLYLHTFNDSSRIIASFLYLCYLDGKERYIDYNFSQEEIGQIIGVSRVQVARFLKFLRKENIITTRRKRIEIIDIERLKELCDFTVYEE